MKRNIPILLAFIMLLSVAIGCQADDGANLSDADVDAVVEEPEIPAEPEVPETPEEPADEEEDIEEEPEPALPEFPVGDALGLLWRVYDEDTTIYLLGTIHILNDTVFPFHQQLIDIITSSDGVVFEVDMGDVEGMEYLAENSVFPEGERLSERISGELFERVLEIYNEIFEAMGFEIEAEMLEMFRPWALASELMSMALMFSEELALMEGSIDSSIYEIAILSGIPVYELEGFRFQVDLFNSFSDELAEAYLAGVVEYFDTPEVFESEIEGIIIWLNAFRDRDVDAFAAAFPRDELSDDPFAQALFDERDPRMFSYILNLMDERPGQFVIAVGAGHMIGEGGLISLFTADGFEVSVVEIP